MFKKVFYCLAIGFFVFPLLSQASTEIDLSEFQFKMIGEEEGDQAGSAVSSAGDVNGDGYDDILVGAPYQNLAIETDDAGATYLIYGGTSLDASIDLSEADVKFNGEAINDYTGKSISSAGDVNGDGYDDILIDSMTQNSNGMDSGAAYLIYGSTSLDSSIDLGDADVKIIGEEAEDYAGRSVSSAGDVNGDGYDDILVGANGQDIGGSGTGSAYIIYGSTSLASSIDLGDADVKLIGETSGDYAGLPISSAGDVNNDGYDDILISAANQDAGGSNSGAIYLIYGSTSLASSINLSDADVKLIGEEASDDAGNSVSSAGDVNNDGYDDILIGAPSQNAGENLNGAAYLIYGSTSLDSSIDLGDADVKLIGEAYLDSAGFAVSSAGDVDNDGYDDILIYAFDDAGGSNAGATYLIYGANSFSPTINLGVDSLAVRPILKFIGEEASDLSINSENISSAGDVNNDGYDDILIGAMGQSEGGFTAGAAYLGYLNIDEDGDGITSSEGLIPGDDPDDTVAQNSSYYNIDPFGNADLISRIRGGYNGNIIVTYADDTKYTFNIFNIVSDKKTKIELYRNSGYCITAQSRGKKIALVNCLNGQLLKKKVIAKNIQENVNSQILKLRNRYFLVNTLKTRTNKAKVVITRILINQEKFGIQDSTKVFKAKNLKVSKTKEGKNNILQIRTNKRIIRKYLVTKKYNLKKKIN